MTATNATRQTIASYTRKGRFDLSYTTKLVREGDHYYLLDDELTGVDTLAGRRVRTAVYWLPPDLVAEVAELVTDPDGFELNDHTTNYSYLHNVLIADLVPTGRPHAWLAQF